MVGWSARQLEEPANVAVNVASFASSIEDDGIDRLLDVEIGLQMATAVEEEAAHDSLCVEMRRIAG